MTTAAVLGFFLLLLELSISRFISFVTSLVCAFGTLLWSYSGTCFSEPLMMCLVIYSLYFLVRSRTASSSRGMPAAGLGGIFLGLAVLTHITAILFVPFFAAYLCWPRQPGEQIGFSWKAVLLFCGGLGLLLLLLGWYNWARFASPWETGRSIDAAMAARQAYGHWQFSWTGILGLLFSPGKSLFLFSPVIVLALFGWKSMAARYPLLSAVLLSAIVTRLVIIGLRSDWHGGFCLGARYFLVVLPVLLLPLGIWLQQAYAAKRRRELRSMGALLALCIVQQVYFSLGEIFLFLPSAMLFTAMPHGHAVSLDTLYALWNVTPLTHLLNSRLGPAVLHHTRMDTRLVFFLASLLVLALLAFALTTMYRFSRHTEGYNEEPHSSEAA